MGEEKKHTSEQKEEDSSKNTELTTEGEKEEQQTKGCDKPSYLQKENKFFSWKERTHSEKTNLILTLGSIASLFLIFYMTSQQNELSRQALEVADSSLTINKEGMIAANNPYIEIQIAYFRFDHDTLNYKIKFKNIGNTPAFNFRYRSAPQINATDKFIRKNTGSIPLDQEGSTFLAPEDTAFAIPQNPYTTSTNEMKSVYREIVPLTIFGIVEYNNFLGYRYRIRFRLVWKPNTPIFSWAETGNEYLRVDKEGKEHKF